MGRPAGAIRRVVEQNAQSDGESLRLALVALIEQLVRPLQELDLFLEQYRSSSRVRVMSVM